MRHAILLSGIALLIVSCALSPRYPDDALEPRRSALREEAAMGIDGPAIAEYRDFIAALSRGYAYPGSISFGVAPWEQGQLGVIRIAVPDGVRQRGIIVAYHGFMSYSVYNIPGLCRIAERGWAVIAVDLPGHGFSTGLSGAIKDFKDYAAVSASVRAWAIEEGLDKGGPWLVLGHSAGGAAALESLLDDRGIFDGGILLAPLVRPRAYGLTQAAAISLGPFVASVPPRGYEEGFLGAPFIPTSWLRALGAWNARLKSRKVPAALPVLCLWGADEDALNVGYSGRMLARLFPALRSATLPGVGHIVFDLGAGQELAIIKILEFLDSCY
ncbi:MAG TPA: hypothetical protein DCG47_13755 [Spirochaetaceae bacterium]|jgi:alpha-beta hydrolase superfamily lysophospholipase|nr:hypothetical protein [Spirochaetaceae bacterium]